MNQSMKIVGSHHEHHLHLKKGEKASQVHVTAGVHELKKVYEIDNKKQQEDTHHEQDWIQDVTQKF